MKKLENKSEITLLLALVIIIIAIVLLIMTNKGIIPNVFRNIAQKEEIEEFSYLVYDNQDETKIKLLVMVQSEYGIEYVEYPDGQILECNGKNKVGIDYVAEKDAVLNFKVKEINKDTIKTNTVLVENKVLEDKFEIEKTYETEGLKILSFKGKFDLPGYNNTSYKIGENGQWVNGNVVTIVDTDIIRDKIENEDNTVTIGFKLTNNTNSYSISFSKKYNIYNREEIQESLIDGIDKIINNSGYYIFTANNQDYKIHAYTYDQDLTISENTEYGSEYDYAVGETSAQYMVVLKVNGNLTIDSGVTLTTKASPNGYGGPKGFLIYCTGTITNNGTINMTARGAKAKGENVYLWKNKTYETESEIYEYIPAYSENANGGRGTNRKTGGGGSGTTYGYASPGIGAQGTSYSGGTGGGGADRAYTGGGPYLYGGNGDENGGAGGNGAWNYSSGGGNGGAGNPGGSGHYARGANGTGGLLIMYSNSLINNGNLVSTGSSGTGSNGGGGSGGGSINVFYNENYENTGSYNVSGGWGSRYGGAGSVSVGQIVDGTYVSTYKDY